ncbi:hypothetical protein, partial [Neptunomonas phycophila]|uniref:hypothetical protein n=1 Tax=Neptunomonas phycophila TaxID=1572645 RepID=UPI0023F6904C
MSSNAATKRILVAAFVFLIVRLHKLTYLLSANTCLNLKREVSLKQSMRVSHKWVGYSQSRVFQLGICFVYHGS